MMKIVSIIILAALSSIVWAKDKPLSVGILLYPDVQIIDYTGPYEIFGSADYKVSTVSDDGKPVLTTMNMQVVPNYSFKNSPLFDILLIPGGDQSKAMHNKATLAWINKQSSSAQYILSVCTGAFILAETGLLDNLSATTFYPALPHFKKHYPKITIQNNKRFVDNGKIITSGGLSSGIDAALHVVAKLEGLEKAKSIAMLVEYAWTPENGFVRGNMADAQLPSFSDALPKNLEFNQLYAYGSETEWLEAYTVTPMQTSSLQNLSDIIAASLAKFPEWKQQTQSKNRWHKADTTGSLWTLDITYKESKNAMQLSLHLYHSPKGE